MLSDAYAEEWARPGRLTAMLNYYRALRLPRRKIGRITVPTLILWGMEDRFLGFHLAELALARCDAGRLVQIDGATHWLHHEKPDLIARQIRTFLAGP